MAATLRFTTILTRRGERETERDREKMGLASAGLQWLPASISNISSVSSYRRPLHPLFVLPALAHPFHSSGRTKLRMKTKGDVANFDFTASVCAQRKCNVNIQRKIAKNQAGKVFGSLLDLENVEDDEACELVNGLELSIGEGTDSISAYLFTAVKNNNGSGILLLSDVYGFEDSSTREFAYRAACNGFNVLVPDLFRGDPWLKSQPKTSFEEWISRQDRKRVAKDVAASTKWMIDEFTAAGISKKLGILGFCYGGGLVIEVLSQDDGGYFGTGVSFYGTRLDPSHASNVKVPVLFISGDNDPLCPVNVLKDMEREIGRGSKLVVFEGRDHGFAHRPKSPEEDDDAEKAFVLVRNWLQDSLVVDT